MSSHRIKKGRPPRLRWRRNIRRMPRRLLLQICFTASALLTAFACAVSSLVIPRILCFVTRRGLSWRTRSEASLQPIIARAPDSDLLTTPFERCSPDTPTLRTFNGKGENEAKRMLVQALRMWNDASWQPSCEQSLTALKVRMPPDAVKISKAVTDAIMVHFAIVADLVLANACTIQHLRSMASMVRLRPSVAANWTWIRSHLGLAHAGCWY